MRRHSDARRIIQKPTFTQLLRSSGLLPYKARLLVEGFDDVDTLCDMTEDDMVKIGIGYSHRVILKRTFAQLRSGSEMVPPFPVWTTSITVDAVLIQ